MTTSTPTPALTSVSLRSPRESEEEGYSERYREADGGLMSIVKATRPDIANAVQEVARPAHDPTPKHLRAIRRVIEYERDPLEGGRHHEVSDQQIDHLC